jgi:hypothetical protein
MQTERTTEGVFVWIVDTDQATSHDQSPDQPELIAAAKRVRDGLRGYG